MVKAIDICEHLNVPKNKLSRCRMEAWAFCQGPHLDRAWFCYEHLTQCPICGDIFCSQCLAGHSHDEAA